MKILQILDERWDSAITEYGISLSSALASRAHHITVIAREGSPTSQKATQKGLDVYPLSTLLTLRQFVGKKSFDVVHAHTGSSHFAAWSSVIFRDIALVRNRGDARPVQWNPGHALLFARTDAVVAASAQIADQYRQHFPSIASRLFTVYPGMEIGCYEAEPLGPLRIALIARLDPVKGQEYFLRAIASIADQLKDELFVIAGEEKNTRQSDLVSLANQLGVSNRIEWHGRLPDVHAFMRSCHVGVVSSIGSEELSRICLEWMSHSRPVIATSVGCLPELVQDGQNGRLLTAKSPELMGEAVLSLLRDPARRRQMGRSAHETAQKRFRKEVFAEEMERVYRFAQQQRGKQFQSFGEGNERTN